MEPRSQSWRVWAHSVTSPANTTPTGVTFNETMRSNQTKKNWILACSVCFLILVHHGHSQAQLKWIFSHIRPSIHQSGTLQERCSNQFECHLNKIDLHLIHLGMLGTDKCQTDLFVEDDANGIIAFGSCDFKNMVLKAPTPIAFFLWPAPVSLDTLHVKLCKMWWRKQQKTIFAELAKTIDLNVFSRSKNASLQLKEKFL